MEEPIERARVAVNTMRARLTILGFNLAITTFQITNTRGLPGGSHLDGFETTVYFSAVAVLLTGVALSIASMVTFIAASTLDREGTCDHRALLAGDLLMYLALAQTVVGFFGPYLHLLEAVPMVTEAEHQALSIVRIGIVVAGSTAWILTTYAGPIVALARSPHRRVTKLFHAMGYLGVLACISRLWWAAQRIEGNTAVGDGSPYAWVTAFAAPVFW